MTAGKLIAVATVALAGASTSPTTAAAEPVFLRNTPACSDASLITGRSTCGRFGSWALLGTNRVHVSVGVEARSLTLEYDRAGGRRAAAAGIESTSIADGADAAGIGLSHRVVIGFGGHFYAGMEVVIGQLALDRAHVFGGGEQAHYFTGVGVGGLALYLGPISVRAEMLGGARVIGAVATSDRTGLRLRTEQSTQQTVLEPRVAAELWLGPWVSLGVRAGTDLLRRDEAMFGAYLSLFSHAFDGSRRPR